MNKAAFFPAAVFLLCWGAGLAAEKDDSVPRWIAAISSEDPAEVKKAMGRLSILTYKGAHAEELTPHLDRIAGFLEHADPTIRRSAIHILQNLRSAERVPEIAKRLKDEDADVRQAAAGALGLLKAAAHSGEIVSLLDDKDFGVRGAAVDALGNLDAKEHAPKMAERLKDENSWVRGLAASALAKFGKEHTAEIAGLLKSPENDRINALYALRTLKAKEFAEEGAELLKDEDYKVRLAAVRFLAEVGDPDLAPRVEPLLKDENGSVQSEAESLLKKWKASPKEKTVPEAQGDPSQPGEKAKAGKP